VRLKSHHATGDVAVRGFIFQEYKHGLMATVYAIKVANGQRAAQI
jgi:hypothetical protein